MSISNRDKKKIFFDLFSQNLDWVKEHPSVMFKPDFNKGYLCPICFDVFFEEDLDTGRPNYLTLEDIPPASLGGKPNALTCKSCNSKNGHELDVYLLNILLQDDANAFLPNSKSNTSFEVDGYKINGTFEVDRSGTAVFNLDQKRSHPVDYKFLAGKVSPTIAVYDPIFFPIQPRADLQKATILKMKFHRQINERRAAIALLRVAYLIACSTFGNGFYINSGLYKVRDQIRNPEKNILPNIFWLKYEFPREMEGINIITGPKELLSFLVVFNLRTKSKTRQFAIALPGPSKPGIDIYENLEKYLCAGDGREYVNITIEQLPKVQYLKEKRLAFASGHFWKKYTNEDYRPNFPKTE